MAYTLEVSSFDALGWMILTSGNMNFVLQMRFYDNISGYGIGYDGKKIEADNLSPCEVQSLIENQVKSYGNILNAFSTATEMINIYIESSIEDDTKIESVSMPSFFLGTPENMLSLIKNDDKTTAIGQFLNEVTTNLAQYNDNIAGFYFGQEDPNLVNNPEHDFIGSMQELSNSAHNQGKKVIWIPFLTSKENFEEIASIVNYNDNEETPLVDIVILQPGRYYDEIARPDPGMTAKIEESILYSIKLNKMVWIEDPDNVSYDQNAPDVPNGVSIGVEFEFDYSRYTGRLANAVAYPSDKQLRLEQYWQLYGDLIGSEHPTAVYNGGPNEQGMRNIKINNNYHSNRNHVAIDTYGNRLDVAVDENGNPAPKKTYAEFSYKGNFAYDTYKEKFTKQGD